MINMKIRHGVKPPFTRSLYMAMFRGGGVSSCNIISVAIFIIIIIIILLLLLILSVLYIVKIALTNLEISQRAKLLLVQRL